MKYNVMYQKDEVVCVADLDMGLQNGEALAASLKKLYAEEGLEFISLAKIEEVHVGMWC